MKTKAVEPAKDSLAHLQKRWTHRDHTSTPMFRMGQGDVSGWARGTTRFKRPDNVEMPPKDSQPIRDMGLLYNRGKAPEAPKAQEIMTGAGVTNSPTREDLIAKNGPAIYSAAELFARLYKRADALTVHAPLSREDLAFIEEQKAMKARVQVEIDRIKAEKDAAIRRDVDMGEQSRLAHEQELENKRRIAAYKKALPKIKKGLKPIAQ